jgi:leader peptidase (prepilin peptidase) / N-methyltransferase
MVGLWWIDATLIGLLGLLVGSFLNVVIYRLPKMMEVQWAEECAAMGQPEAAAVQEKTSGGKPVFNLMVPRSRCPQCGHLIAWYENIPVISYLVLRGKCSACKAPISARYPAVELMTGALFFFCAMRFGWTITTAVWCLFCAAIVALAAIDWDTTLLPDDITLPLLWLGLIVAALRWNPAVNLPDALWEGMGYGDFKLLAALGAWFGWQALVPIILMSSVIGAIVGIAMKMSTGLREGCYIPFGPFLAGAGLTALIFGPQSILRAVGL